VSLSPHDDHGRERGEKPPRELIRDYPMTERRTGPPSGKTGEGGKRGRGGGALTPLPILFGRKALTIELKFLSGTMNSQVKKKE